MSADLAALQPLRGGPEVDVGCLPVRAYIQTREGLVRVEGVALLQTPDAVLVRYGYPFQAWVWRAAVKHRRNRPQQGP